MNACGLREGFSLRDYQLCTVYEILKEFDEKRKKNIFVSLPQGTGKTIIALAALSKLINTNKVRKVLVLLPRRVLVSQWVDRAQEMFYGLGLIKSPTLSKEQIERIRGWLKHSGAVGIAMTCNPSKTSSKNNTSQEKTSTW